MAIVQRIKNANRTFGAPQDWNDEHGKVVGLPIRDAICDGVPYMISAWELTPEELKKLQTGETLKLWVQGVSHPVVSITVGEIE